MDQVVQQNCAHAQSNSLVCAKWDKMHKNSELKDRFSQFVLQEWDFGGNEVACRCDEEFDELLELQHNWGNVTVFTRQCSGNLTMMTMSPLWALSESVLIKLKTSHVCNPHHLEYGKFLTLLPQTNDHGKVIVNDQGNGVRYIFK